MERAGAPSVDQTHRSGGDRASDPWVARLADPGPERDETIASAAPDTSNKFSFDGYFLTGDESVHGSGVLFSSGSGCQFSVTTSFS